MLDLILAVASATVAPPVQPASGDATTAVGLFRQICFEGGGTFTRQQVQPVTFRNLPAAMRDFVREDKAGVHYRLLLLEQPAFLSVGTPRKTAVGLGHTCTLVAHDLPVNATMAMLDPTMPLPKVGLGGGTIGRKITTGDGYAYEVRHLGPGLTAIQSIVRETD